MESFLNACRSKRPPPVNPNLASPNGVSPSSGMRKVGPAVRVLMVLISPKWLPVSNTPPKYLLNQYEPATVNPSVMPLFPFTAPFGLSQEYPVNMSTLDGWFSSEEDDVLGAGFAGGAGAVCAAAPFDCVAVP